MHFRLAGEEATFCGRNSYGWSITDGQTLAKAIDSPYLCKRCYKAALK